MKNNLKLLRVAKNYTQSDLAEKVGVSRQTINAIESNKYLPSLSLAFNLAQIFAVTIEDIFYL